MWTDLRDTGREQPVERRTFVRHMATWGAGALGSSRAGWGQPPTPPQRSYWPTREWRISRPESEGLDAARLAKLSITGGSIRNIALGAAFLAADAGEPVTPAHVLRAATTEYGKLNKALTESETRGWS